MPEIVQAARDDARAVAGCVRAAYAHYVERIGREPAPMTADYEALIDAGEVWVARAGDGVAGVLVLRPQPPALLLENVAVAPDRQGEGLGRALMAFAEHRARAEGLAEVVLYTNERMTENLRFYPALGYAETGRAMQDGFARVFFRKPV
ncbi:MAG TPA: GNAT family N-acetyltransferase [Gaiellales bacterium]|nr:GNAT family N-acetyltransferase [Gaiellales bacterium]